MFEGDIHEINLVERLIQLWREQFTGAIRFENDGIIKIVYLKGGDILSASTNDRADSVDEILMRAGKVTKEHVKQALSKRKENETLGDALLNLGFITRKELTWARRIQVINVIRSVNEWTAGSFTIVADYLPKREEGMIFPLPQLIVEMTVTDQERGKFERALESGTVVFQTVPGQEETFRGLGLNEDAEAVMAQVDGERTASEVAAASRQETFNAFKLLHALSLLGILERKHAFAEVSSAGFEDAGVADAADAWGAGAPQFDLDDEIPPSLAVPTPVEEPPSYEPAIVEPPIVAPAMTSPPIAMPAWEESPKPPANPVEERRWGFDEAQIETSRKATSSSVFPSPGARTRSHPPGSGTTTRRPAGKPAPKRKRGLGLIVALIAVVAMAAVGFFGFNWWTSRQAVAPTPASTPPAVEAPQPPVPIEEPPPSVATETTAPPAQQPVVQPKATPPVPPSGGTERSRYDAMAREFAANPSGNFTVQFAIVCETSNVTKALRSSGRDSVWFVPINVKGRSCYRMFWGRFGSREEAERAMAQLPGELRESRPGVVTIPR